MESTLTAPPSTVEIAESLGAYVIRKRPLKSLQGIGFISQLWVRDALNAGLFPNTRSYALASIIAGAGDCDGRYCFLYLAGMVERGGGTMSRATIKRALRDLIRAGLVRKLDRRQTRAFFSDDLHLGQRWADRLPCVLELLVPACAYPEQTLEEINEIRAKLGEEPLDETTRPYPSVGTTAQCASGPGSNCPTDLCPSDACPRRTPDSVRGASTTGGGNQGENGRNVRPGHPLVAAIPDSALRNPFTDRLLLDYALRRLWEQGMTGEELTALLGDIHRLRRPFPALMARMRGLTPARDFLRGLLGNGIFGSGLRLGDFAPGQPPAGDDDLFDRPPRFTLDALGQAMETCPEHPTVRNMPGYTCGLCGRPCRSHPGEIMHPPVPKPAAPEKPSRPDPEPEPGDQEPHMEEDLDPELRKRMSASLAGAGIASGEGAESVPEPAPAHPPTRQKIIARLRQRLSV